MCQRDGEVWEREYKTTISDGQHILLMFCTASDSSISTGEKKKRSKVLLLHPIKLIMMLYRKVAQAADWSPVTQVMFTHREHYVTA